MRQGAPVPRLTHYHATALSAGLAAILQVFDAVGVSDGPKQRTAFNVAQANVIALLADRSPLVFLIGIRIGYLAQPARLATLT